MTYHEGESQDQLEESNLDRAARIAKAIARLSGDPLLMQTIEGARFLAEHLEEIYPDASAESSSSNDAEDAK